RISPFELLEIKSLGWQRTLWSLGLSCGRMQIAFIRRVTAPLAQAAPEAPKNSRSELCASPHQSSPCAAPEKSGAHRVATYGDSCSTASRRRLRSEDHCTRASTISTRIISARTP